MWPQITSMLSPWQWVLLALVPPAIVLLYFLKLKRQPLEVPSTYLWRKSIEDLHVNSLWQRLRRNLLLWLQLLLLALIVLALLDPSWEGAKFSGNRFIFIIDNSASMASTDGSDAAGDRCTRLEEAKQRIGEMIAAMKTGDAGMIISFSDTAHVAQEFTTNHAELSRKLAAIEPTSRRTSLAGALRLAAGLANPGRTGDPENADDAAAAEARPAELYVLSDFKFPDVLDFSLGNLDPNFMMVGEPTSGNVGIVTFSVRRHESRADKIQVFARLENHTSQDQTATLELALDDQMIDIKQETIPANESKQVGFTIEDVESGVLKLTHDIEDPLSIDNTAWAVVNVPRRSRLLFVSSGNVGMQRALKTDKAVELADIQFAVPADLEKKEYQQKAATGFYDLIIYDNCQPEQMPNANTLFIGKLPPIDRWVQSDTIIEPQIIDTERTHPLMQLLELGDVGVVRSLIVEPPAGGTRLIESQSGPIFAIGPRDGYEDAVLGFTFEAEDDKGNRFFNTNWPLRRSFPVFVQEVITYLGNSRRVFSTDTVPPGKPYVIYRPTGPDSLKVKVPGGSTVPVSRGRQNRYNFTRTDQVGIYTVNDQSANRQRFAVNLFDSLESDIQPVSGEAVKRIGNVKVDVRAKPNWDIARRHIWKLIILLGLAVLVFEWYIYNRRVYI